MSVLVLVEHPVGVGPYSGFEEWKRVFDSDPVDRKAHGVKRHWIYRSPDADDVVIGCEFDSMELARAFKADHDTTLADAWRELGLDVSPARVFELAETVEY